MTIVRTVHDKTNPYVMLNRSALQDMNLSLKAKGFWAFCLSRPDDWEFKVTELSKVTGESDVAIYKILKELIDNGYCARSQKKEGSYFLPVTYTLYEIKIILPLPKNEDAHFEHPQNAEALLSKEEEQNTNCLFNACGREEGKSVSFCEKTHPDGHKFKVSRDEIVTKAVLLKKNFSLDEIHKAFEILVESKQPIRDALAFVEGTINKLRSTPTKINTNKPKEEKIKPIPIDPRLSNEPSLAEIMNFKCPLEEKRKKNG